MAGKDASIGFPMTDDNEVTGRPTTRKGREAMRIFWSVWFRPRAVRKLVDVDQIPQLLRNVSEGELEEFREFGFVMVDEVLGRINQLEAKAVIVFGFSAAVIAFLIGDVREWASAPLGIKMLVTAATLLASIAGAFAARAMMVTGGWSWPSERDWFPEKAFGNLNAIRRRHLDSLLFAHQKQSAIADSKAAAIVWAQRLLLISFTSLSILLVWIIFAPPGLKEFIRVPA